MRAFRCVLIAVLLAGWSGAAYGAEDKESYFGRVLGIFKEKPPAQAESIEHEPSAGTAAEPSGRSNIPPLDEPKSTVPKARQETPPADSSLNRSNIPFVPEQPAAGYQGPSSSPSQQRAAEAKSSADSLEGWRPWMGLTAEEAQRLPSSDWKTYPSLIFPERYSALPTFKLQQRMLREAVEPKPAPPPELDDLRKRLQEEQDNAQAAAAAQERSDNALRALRNRQWAIVLYAALLTAALCLFVTAKLWRVIRIVPAAPAQPSQAHAPPDPAASRFFSQIAGELERIDREIAPLVSALGITWPKLAAEFRRSPSLDALQQAKDDLAALSLARLQHSDLKAALSILEEQAEPFAAAWDADGLEAFDKADSLLGALNASLLPQRRWAEYADTLADLWHEHWLFTPMGRAAETLGLDKLSPAQIDLKRIAKAKRDVSRIHHPDKPGGSHDRTIRINDAAELLIAWIKNQRAKAA